MNGGGFIQQMVNVMRENRALLSSKRRKNNETNNLRSGKTRLKFPKGDPTRIRKIKRKYRRQSNAQWMLIYIFFGLFFGAILIWVFT